MHNSSAESRYPTEEFTLVVPISSLIRYMSVSPLRYVRTPNLVLSVGLPSYSHLIGGTVLRWVLGAPKSAALVPPRSLLLVVPIQCLIRYMSVTLRKSVHQIGC